MHSKLLSIEIRNLGCFDNSGVKIALDNIICLVGQNNSGKSTVLRAYEAAVVGDALNKNEVHNGAVHPPTVILDVHIPVGTPNISEDWKVSEGEYKIIRTKWEWPLDGGKPTRSTFNPQIGDFDPEKNAGGLDQVFYARLPQPLRIESLENPNEVHKGLIKLVLEPIVSKLKSRISNPESEYQKKYRDFSGVVNSELSSFKDSLADVEDKVSKLYKKVFPETKLGIELDSGEVEYDLAKKIVESSHLAFHENEKKLSWNRQGTGSQRALFWSMLKVRSDIENENDSLKKKEDAIAKLQKELSKVEAKAKKTEADNDKIVEIKKKIDEVEAGTGGLFLPAYMLLIDEPEIALHPDAIRAAKKQLYELATASGWQVMLTTHHPVFIDPSENHTTILRLERNVSIPKVYRTDTMSFSGDEKEVLKILLQFDSSFSEVFFAKKVILVEGDTEYTAFNNVYMLDAEMSSYPAKPTIVRARGKSTLVILQKILRHFKLQYSIIHDIDSPKNKAGKGNSAYSVNFNISNEVAEARKIGLKVNHRVSCPNFEDSHKIEIGSKKDKPYNTFKALKDSEKMLSVKNVLKELMEDCSIGAGDGGAFEDNLKEWILDNNITDSKFKFE